MSLAHTWVGAEGAPYLGFVTHGVLGAGHNLRSFMRKVLEARPDFRFALIDLRLHGKSGGAAGPHTLASCVDDFLHLAEEIGHPDVVIGHSLGGKVALCYAERVSEPGPADGAMFRKPAQVWALDSDPGAQVPTLTHQVGEVLRAARSLAMPQASREGAVEGLVAAGLSSGLANWLATNLERDGDAYRWRLDFEAISELLGDYFSVDLWPFLSEVARGVRRAPHVHLLVAERSDRWSGGMKERARELCPSSHFALHELPDAGHWVHVDNPEGLKEILVSNLPPELPLAP